MGKRSVSKEFRPEGKDNTPTTRLTSRSDVFQERDLSRYSWPPLMNLLYLNTMRRDEVQLNWSKWGEQWG